MATAGILDPRRGMINLTPEQIKRDREMADELLKSAMQPQPIQDWTQGAAQVLGAIGAVVRQRRADSAQRDNDAYNSQAISQLLAGGSSFPPAPASAGGIPAPAAQGQISASSPAPVDISGSRQDFVNALLPAAIEEGKRTGIDPRIIVAQAAQETGWGKSAPGNNYFGIKSHGQAGGNSMMTTEVINGQPVRVRDSFRGYDSPEASVRGYGDFMLQNPRYQAMRSAQGMDAQLEALQASGYATDPNYSRSVGAIARGIQLPQEVAAVGPMTAYSDPMVSQSPAAAAIQTQAPQETASAPPLPPVSVSTPPTPPEQQMAQELAQSAPPVANPNVGILPVLTGQPGQTNMGGGDMLVRALQAMSDPRANEGTQGIAKLLVQQEMAKREAAAKQAERQALWSREDQRNAVLDGRADRDYGLQREKFEADQRNAATTGDIKEYEYYAAREKATGRDPLGPLEWDQARRKAGAPNTNVNVGGGSDKQVFDEMKASSDAARAAVTGLTSLREARKAVEGGAILGAGADTKLGFQKLAVSLGLANPEAVINTETFRSAIAPQVAAMTKATVGSTQISNADRDFAQDAAGGRITLEKGSILRLLDIMERAGNVIVKQHSDRLNAVYPDNGSFGRERALFGVQAPQAEAPGQEAPAGAPAAGTVMDGYRFKGGDPSDQRNWEQVQ